MDESGEVSNPKKEMSIQIRKENFYKGIGTNELFNYENRLHEVRGKYHNKNKQFCQRFNTGYDEQ